MNTKVLRKCDNKALVTKLWSPAGGLEHREIMSCKYLL